MFDFIKKLFGKDKYSKYIESCVPLAEKDMPSCVPAEGKSERTIIKESIIFILNNSGEEMHHTEIYEFSIFKKCDHKKFISVLYYLASKGQIEYGEKKGYFKISS